METRGVRWRREKMRGFCDMRKWLRLPGRVGLLLGLGALSVTGARANTAAPLPAADPVVSGGLSIRSEGGGIYVAENGRDFQEIRLGDTQEARHLAQLLAGREPKSGEAGIKLAPLILAGAGGSGFDWTSPPHRNEAAKPGDASRNRRGRPATASPPVSPPSRNAISERTRDKG